MSKNTTLILKELITPTRADLRPLSLCVDNISKKLFDQGYTVDEIRVTKNIYRDVAEELGKTTVAVTKSVERMMPLCWEALEKKNLVRQYIGRESPCRPTTRELLIYLAFFTRLGHNFNEIAYHCPEISFRTPTEIDFSTFSDVLTTVRNQPANSGAPLFLVYNRDGELTVIPVCKSCLDALDQTRRNFCSSCEKSSSGEKPVFCAHDCTESRATEK